jgi:hypothetical protein
LANFSTARRGYDLFAMVVTLGCIEIDAGVGAYVQQATPPTWPRFKVRGRSVTMSSLYGYDEQAN